MYWEIPGMGFLDELVPIEKPFYIQDEINSLKALFQVVLLLPFE